MVRSEGIELARSVLGQDFIGPDELKMISVDFNFDFNFDFPDLKLSIDDLNKIRSSNMMLILFWPYCLGSTEISIKVMRENFGVSGEFRVDGFYNQDWYINDPFYEKSYSKPCWLRVSKEVEEGLRGVGPIQKYINEHALDAVLYIYTFFVTLFLRQVILWPHDYVWTSTKDYNGDWVYIGRYKDINGINRDGLSIHRYLSISKIYSFSSGGLIV
jgi:hypothetical protein